ncbi:plastocyanin/azurin family copper-binding protein [Haladaptatus sp. W1]|uniref:plastocyanin/azurin family copper-binding protein n=1 Tax=Haladaptatus sp. W1 TaxID=1897478 RepID=UPI0020C7B9BE|nr:plastocyanin/azurin family copper-binding protein [Haladaptatus sp. W1]
MYQFVRGRDHDADHRGGRRRDGRSRAGLRVRVRTRHRKTAARFDGGYRPLGLEVEHAQHHRRVATGRRELGRNAGRPERRVRRGYRYHYTFEVPGKYHYWCQPHKAMGMVADIVVEE